MREDGLLQLRSPRRPATAICFLLAVLARFHGSWSPVASLAPHPPMLACSRRELLASLGAAAVAVEPGRSLALNTAEQRLPATYFGGNITDFKEKSSGLLVLDRTPGSGELCCSEGARVTLDWSLRKLNGFPIESTKGFGPPGKGDAAERQRPDSLRFVPKRLVLGIRGVGMRDDIVEGVREAVIGMKVGGTRRVIVPPKLGWYFGEQEPMPVDMDRQDRLQSVRKDFLVMDLRLREIGPAE
eukprot:TRINITY_DN97328_c0_g1_i1.p1 TRINITY_DN97328_c0_g1~~TRINITY_DN97328_c0_g1_i1.p1  ORF type:complete len:256 (+),score=61.51 TRINITY_DN97328_c0_g1_i1:43-768(+)